jgi:hypothetical protein
MKITIMKTTIMKTIVFVFFTLLLAGCFNEGVDPARITDFKVTGHSGSSTQPQIILDEPDKKHFNIEWTVDASPYEYSIYINNSGKLDGTQVHLETDVCGQGTNFTCGQRRIIRCFADSDRTEGLSISSISCDNNKVYDSEGNPSLVNNHIDTLVTRNGVSYIIFKACNGQGESCRTTSKAVNIIAKPQLSSFSISPDTLFEGGVVDSVIRWKAKQIQDSGTYNIGVKLVEFEIRKNAETQLDEVHVLEEVDIISLTDDVICDKGGVAYPCSPASSDGDYVGELSCKLAGIAPDYTFKCVGGGVDSGEVDVKSVIDFKLHPTDYPDANDPYKSVDALTFIRRLELTICDASDSDVDKSCSRYNDTITLLQDRPVAEITAIAGVTAFNEKNSDTNEIILPVLKQGSANNNVSWETKTLAITAEVAANPLIPATYNDYNMSIFASVDDSLNTGSDHLLTSITCAGTNCGDAPVLNESERKGFVNCELNSDLVLSCNAGGPKDFSNDVQELPYEAGVTIPGLPYDLIAETCNPTGNKLCTYDSQTVLIAPHVPSIIDFNVVNIGSPTKNLSIEDTGNDFVKLSWNADIMTESDANNEDYYVNLFVRNGQGSVRLFSATNVGFNRDKLEVMPLSPTNDPAFDPTADPEFRKTYISVGGCDADNCSDDAKPDGVLQYGELICSLTSANLLVCTTTASDKTKLTADISGYVRSGSDSVYMFLEVCDKDPVRVGRVGLKAQCRYKASSRMSIIR